MNSETDFIAWASTDISPEQVGMRRMQARRNGYAAWLWPNVDIAQWRKSLEEVVSVTRAALAGASSPELVCHDAKATCIAAYTSGMGPLLGYWIENGIIRAPGEIGDILCLHLSHNRRRMVRLSAVLREIVKHLNDEGIFPVVLKGMDTAFRFFPEPGVRPLSDIDLFIPEASIPGAERILSRLGYQREPRMREPYACDWIDPSVRALPRTLTFVHEDDPWSVDVLGSLNKRLPTGTVIRFDELLSCDGPADSEIQGQARVMAQPLLALYLAVHFSQTLLNATILRVLELVHVIRRSTADGTLNWSDFLRDAKIIGGLRFVYPALVFVEQLASGTIPADIMQAAANEASGNLRSVMANLALATAQPLDRHSVRERFMWASNWREILVQIASELSLDGRGMPPYAAAYSIGTKLWALCRRRYST
jgi:hypothetical protein